MHRRLEQELGLSADLHYLYKFEYRAAYGDAGTEHELCWVYAGVTDATPMVNTTEIANWCWIAPDPLDDEISPEPRNTSHRGSNWSGRRCAARKARQLEKIISA